MSTHASFSNLCEQLTIRLEPHLRRNMSSIITFIQIKSYTYHTPFIDPARHMLLHSISSLSRYNLNISVMVNSRPDSPPNSVAEHLDAP